jgi:hypothetical protein
MHIDSVRELKAQITQRVLVPTAEKAVAERGIPLAAQRLDPALAEPHRTLAMGISRRTKRDFRLAVRVQRRAFQEGRVLDQICAMCRDEVEIRYIGRVIKLKAPWHQQRNRPLRIGGSVGHYRITAGTLGCFVRRREDGTVLILSNNHVLADENAGRIGDAILQPGRYDGGRQEEDRIGALAALVRLDPRGTNLVDCAVAGLDTGIDHDHRHLTGIGRLAGVAPGPVTTDTVVAKVGRTTGATRGRITAFELDNVVVSYGIGNLRFDDQIEIESTEDGPFSDGGDSGSLIVDGDRRGAALLFAGSDQGGRNGRGLTFANPLPTVLEQLGLELLY